MAYQKGTELVVTGNNYNNYAVGETVTVTGYDERHDLHTVVNKNGLSQTVVSSEVALPEPPKVEKKEKKETTA